MKYKIITLLLFSLIFMLIIPSYSDTAMLQYNRNEYYETCEVAYNMEDTINSTHLYDFALNDYYAEMDSGLQFTSGYFGEAIMGFGDNQNITMGNPNTIGAFTIEFWLYPTADSDIRSLFGYGSTNYIARYNNGKAFMISGLDSIFGTSVIPLYQWTHLAFVYDPSNSSYLARIYVNGTLDSGIKTQYRNSGWTQICYIGDGYYRYTIGKIDEFRFFKGEARTRTEIQLDMVTPMAMKLTIEGLEANEDVTQLWYPNMTLFEQKTADSEGKVEYNVYSFSNKSSEYQGIVNIYHEDIQYEGYIIVIYWGDVYRFTVMGLFADLFTQLFFGTGAWLGILVLILGSLLGLKFYKYTALIFSVFFVLLGLQYYQLFNSGVSDFMWFFVFCWVMPIFLIFAMFKMRR